MESNNEGHLMDIPDDSFENIFTFGGDDPLMGVNELPVMPEEPFDNLSLLNWDEPDGKNALKPEEEPTPALNPEEEPTPATAEKNEQEKNSSVPSSERKERLEQHESHMEFRDWCDMLFDILFHQTKHNDEKDSPSSEFLQTILRPTLDTLVNNLSNVDEVRELTSSSLADYPIEADDINLKQLFREWCEESEKRKKETSHNLYSVGIAVLNAYAERCKLSVPLCETMKQRIEEVSNSYLHEPVLKYDIIDSLEDAFEKNVPRFKRGAIGKRHEANYSSWYSSTHGQQKQSRNAPVIESDLVELIEKELRKKKMGGPSQNTKNEDEVNGNNGNIHEQDAREAPREKEVKSKYGKLSKQDWHEGMQWCIYADIELKKEFMNHPKFLEISHQFENDYLEPHWNDYVGGALSKETFRRKIPQLLKELQCAWEFYGRFDMWAERKRLEALRRVGRLQANAFRLLRMYACNDPNFPVLTGRLHRDIQPDMKRFIAGFISMKEVTVQLGKLLIRIYPPVQAANLTLELHKRIPKAP